MIAGEQVARAGVARIALSLTVAALLLTGCGGVKAPWPSHLVERQDAGYTLHVPKGWEINRNLQGPGSLEVAPPGQRRTARGALPISLDLEVATAPADMDLEAATTQGMALLEQGMPQATLDGPHDAAVDGQPAKEITVTLPIGTERYSIREVFIVTEARIFRVTMTAPADQFPEHEPTFDEIIKTLRFTDG